MAAAPLVAQLEQGKPYPLLNLIDGEAFDLFTPKYATATRRAPSVVAGSPNASTVAYLDVHGVTIIAVDGTRSPIVIPASANAFTWSPDAALITVGAEDGVALYRQNGSFEQRLTEDPVTNIRWSPDGSMIAYRPIPGQLRVWQAGEEFKLPTNGKFFWLPNGRILLQRGIFDPATPNDVLPHDGYDWARKVTLFPDGDLIALGIGESSLPSHIRIYPARAAPQSPCSRASPSPLGRLPPLSLRAGSCSPADPNTPTLRAR